MAARIREIRDSLLALIRAKWGPSGADEVIGSYTFDVYTSNLKGRKVLVFPESSAGSPATREEDTNDYGYQVWVVERYADQGPPPDGWVDARVDFVSQLEDWLGNPRKVPYLDDQPGVYPQEAGVSTVYDVVDLIEHKLFVSVLALVLREDAPAPPE